MKKLLALTLLLSATAYANNIPDNFNNRPVLPTVQKLRTFDWTWQNVAKLSNISTREADPDHAGRLMQTLTISEHNPNTTITFYGSKTAPDVAVIEARTWGAANTQDTAFLRLDKLKGNTTLKSNCNFKNISISESGNDDGFEYESGAELAFQQAYKLPKSISSFGGVGKRDLFMASSQVETYVITGSFQTQAYTLSIITPDKAKLGKLINMYGWDTNKNGNAVKCTVQ